MTMIRSSWRTPGLLSSHLILCLSWLFKFSYCQTSHSLRMTVAAMLYFVAVFVNCPLFAPVEGATTQMSLFSNTGLTAVSVTWSGQLVPVARLACLLLASGNIKGGRKAVGDKNSLKKKKYLRKKLCVWRKCSLFSIEHSTFRSRVSINLSVFFRLCTSAFPKERKALLSVATVCAALYCTVWGERFMLMPFLWLSRGEIHSLTTVWNVIGLEWIAFTLCFEIYVYLAHVHGRFY